MKTLILTLLFLISLLNASMLDGRWSNSSAVAVNELQRIEIRGNMIKPYFKTRHGLKAFPAIMALGNANIKSSAWRLDRTVILILVQSISNSKIRVEISKNSNNYPNPPIRRYVFSKGLSDSNNFPFQGMWINPDPYTSSIHIMQIKKHHGKIAIKAWKRCGKRDCLLGEAIARKEGNKLYANVYNNRVIVKVMINGLNYNPNRQIYKKLKVDITTNLNGGVNRQTIYLLRKHRH